MDEKKLAQNNRFNLVLLAIMGMLLFSVQVCDAYFYTVSIDEHPVNVVQYHLFNLTVHCYDSDHPDWIFPFAEGQINITSPTGSHSIMSFTTNDTGWYTTDLVPSVIGTYTFKANSSYNYDLTPYLHVGLQSGESWQSTILVSISQDKIGVYRPSAHTWYLDVSGNGAYGGGDASYSFGGTSDIRITGDWDKNGITEIGVYRPSTHRWYLDYSGDGAYGGGDAFYYFGGPSDIPVTGDWDRDGITEIGVYRQSTHTWYLDVSGDGAYGGGDYSITTFGGTSDLPVTGDWNSDGATEIGVYRPSTHTWYLDYSRDYHYGDGDISTKFGGTSDLPAAGDWNADGTTEIGVYRPLTHTWYLDVSGNGAYGGGDVSYTFGGSADKPAIGRWG